MNIFLETPGQRWGYTGYLRVADAVILNFISKK
jgi:hypothetical protein